MTKNSRIPTTIFRNKESNIVLKSSPISPGDFLTDKERFSNSKSTSSSDNLISDFMLKLKFDLINISHPNTSKSVHWRFKANFPTNKANSVTSKAELLKLKPHPFIFMINFVNKKVGNRKH